MGLGWGTFFGGLGKLIDLLPIQGREERWRNELDNLNKQRRSLLYGKCTKDKATKLAKMDAKIAYLTQLLKNVRG